MTAPISPMAGLGVGHGKTRDDIQALRALAILLVLLQHARVPGVPAGFLGVDLFFVISGFLMTSQIDSQLTRGTFGALSFYARRARRILPAAYATLFATALAAPFLLDSMEYRLFLTQLAGSVTFVVNMVLWKQSDYFSTGADLKPLLHMWSLAIEEQFYFGLPLLLWLLPRHWRLAGIALCVAASLGACLWLQPRAPTLAFYFLGTRAWELGLGSIVALLVNRGLPTRAMIPARLGAIAAIIGMALATSSAGHPGLPAIIVCLGTAVLLVPGLEWRAKGPMHAVILMGDRSYSLYLVHWPLFAFANNIFAGEVPEAINVILLFCCFPLAELQYRFIEQPCRRMEIDLPRLLMLVAIPVLIVTVAYSARLLWREPARAQDRQPNLGLSVDCAGGARFDAPPACVRGAHPDVLVWGDSFAMHVVPGVLDANPRGLIQATKTSCGPFLDIAPINSQNNQAPWAQGCMAFNDSVIAYIGQHPEIRTIVLSSILIPYLTQERGSDWRLIERTSGGMVEVAQDRTRVLAALHRTVKRLRSMGRHAVLIGPPSGIDVDFSRCQLRRAEARPVLGTWSNCEFSAIAYDNYRRPILDFLAAAERERILPVMRPDNWLCAGGVCRTIVGDVILYADHAHLSRRGSILIARAMDWRRTIARPR